MRFSVQDEGGRVSVNAPAFPLFATLLRHFGVSASDARGIMARVEDYIDANDTLSLNGAERHDYARSGAPPPLNWIMASPHDFLSVLGVAESIPPAAWRRLRPLLTTRPVYSYNFNTMHPEVLAVALGLDEKGLEEVLEERDKGPLYRLNRIAMLTGRHLDIDDLDVRLIPTSSVRIAVWHESRGSRTLTGLTLTPLGDSAPWRIDYRYSEPIAPPGDSRTPREAPLAVAAPLLH